MHRVDVNSATREELMAVQGIDGAAADKIIQGRPWKNTQALVEKNVLTKNDFAKVKSRIMTKRLAAPSKTP
jgi:DNA uptake protein ComE-like DNA-binding protein